MEADKDDSDKSEVVELIQGDQFPQIDSVETEETAEENATEAEYLSSRSLDGEKRQAGSKKGHSSVSPTPTTKVMAKATHESDDDDVSQKSGATAEVDLNRPELWKAAEALEQIKSYRKKSSKARKRFVAYEKQLPPDHPREPEVHAFADSVDLVNNDVMDLVEEAVTEAAAQLQIQKAQHDAALAKALAEIAELKKTLTDNQAIAHETLREVKAGNELADATYDLALNNSMKLDQCLGRPTFQAWIEQGWQAFTGAVPPEMGFFQPRSLWEWFQPQTFAMGLTWVKSWADERLGSKLGKKFNIKTRGFFKVLD